MQPKFQPLEHQKPALEYLLNGGKRAVLVWHRRAGKDLMLWNFTWVAAQQRVGIYYYFYPTYSQAKKAIWYGMDEQGISFRDYIPSDLVDFSHDTDMRIHFRNGSILQLIGSDNVNSIMSTNPIGCVFSEYALQDPAGWRYVSPILAKNGGWAAFPYTPRGHNHGYDLYHRTKGREGWFHQLLTVDDTKLITLEAIDDVRATGVPEAIIQQEYWCSWSQTMEGSYFGQQMDQAESRGQIRELLYDPRQPVHTAWDIGVNDSCTIWFVQTDGRMVWAIDFIEKANNRGLPEFAAMLREKGYVYGTHLGPHDVGHREFGTGGTVQETAAGFGIDFTIVPRTAKQDQFSAAHVLIPRTIFCKVRCERGVEGLRGYEREWDSKAQVFKNTPKHNWASHIADAYMTLAVGFDLLSNDSDLRPAYSVGGNSTENPGRYNGFDPRKDSTYASRQGQERPELQDEKGYGRVRSGHFEDFSRS